LRGRSRLQRKQRVTFAKESFYAFINDYKYEMKRGANAPLFFVLLLG
jgi:hypothetical protein